MTQSIDTSLPYEEQILMVEARLTRRRQREALVSEEGRQWVIDNVDSPIEDLRELIRQRDAA